MTSPPASAWHLRGLDIVLVVASAPIWLPVFAIVALACLVTSGRPVFFAQTRIGKDGRPFSMLKFRSMKNGHNPLVPDTNRITPIGHLLRRSSLDELPQLINVLRGAMSLVGPRPMLPNQTQKLTQEQRTRLTVPPGLTGLAQVNGRNSLTWDERFVHDVEWAADPNVVVYLSTLARTGSTVVLGTGVAGHDVDDPFVSGIAS